VQEAISDTGYSHNVVARELKTGSSGLVGVLIVDYNEFYTDVLRGVEDSVGELGWRFVVSSTGEQWEKQRELIQIMVSRRMQGILVAPVAGFDPEFIQAYVPASIPVVQFDRSSGGHMLSVSSENAQGAELLIEHLYKHGYRHVSFITGADPISSLQDRKRGLLAAAIKFGMEACVCEMPTTSEGGFVAAAEVLDQPKRPDAIVAGNNPILLGIIRAMRQRQIRIGGDVALVSFDDLPWCEVSDPPITVVHQSSYVMGCQAVEMLKSLVHGQHVKSRTLPMALIVRGSCGCQSHWE